MVRSKLIDKIKEEIKNYIGTPYWINILKDGVITKEGVLGGKGNWQEILEATKKISKEKNVDISNFSPKDLYNFQKKHRIGIDCSGLVFHILDAFDKYNGQDGILTKVIGTDNKYGVRRVSVKMLTSPINSIQINDYDQIKTADLIRIDEGRHLLFIIEKNKNVISYVHSSDRTQIRGVHYGQIEIIEPQKPLNFQKWSEFTLDNKSYDQLIYPEKGDGIYRLNCFC
jgi:hypothetical protein